MKDENRENGFTIWEIGSIEIFILGGFMLKMCFFLKRICKKKKYLQQRNDLLYTIYLALCRSKVLSVVRWSWLTTVVSKWCYSHCFGRCQERKPF